MATRQRENRDETIRYLVQMSRGSDFIIEIAASWRVTFGYVNPSASSQGHMRGEGHCMRIWEGEKLRAVYGDVRGFRDMSIPLARKVERETGSATWTMDSQGNFEKSEQREVETTLELEAVDEDSPF